MGTQNQKDLAILKHRMKMLEAMDTKNMTQEQLKEHMEKIMKIRAQMAAL